MTYCCGCAQPQNHILEFNSNQPNTIGHLTIYQEDQTEDQTSQSPSYHHTLHISPYIRDIGENMI